MLKHKYYNRKKLLATYIILLATHHYFVHSLYMLSLQGKDSRSEYRTTDRKHFLTLNTAAIVYINIRLEHVQFCIDSQGSRVHELQT